LLQQLWKSMVKIGYNDYGYYVLGYNDHGYNEFTAITSWNFWSQMLRLVQMSSRL